MQTAKDLSKSANNDRHQFLDAFRNIEHKLENMFQHLWHNPFHKPEIKEQEWPVSLFNTPRIDVIERDEEVVVRAELPGFEKQDLDISLSGQRLMIHAKYDHEDKQENGDYLRQEILHKEICRNVYLPAEVCDDNVKTDFKNGMLQLTLKKPEQAHRRKIPVE